MTKETLFEAGFPDLMKNTEKTNQNIKQLNQSIQNLSGAFAAKGLMGGNGQNALFGRLNLPINFHSMIETMVSGQVPGVYPDYSRVNVTVKSGTTKHINSYMPSGDQGIIVYSHTMYLNNFSNEFLLSLQVDNDPPLINQVPMNDKIQLSGSFMRPARTSVMHVLENNDSYDITFTFETMAALMNSDFVENVFKPVLQEQNTMIEDLAKSIRKAEGK